MFKLSVKTVRVFFKKNVFKLSVKTVRVKEKEEFSKINKEKKGKNEMSKKYLS